MISFFLLLSFLIHIILFITIYHLYEKTKRDKDEQVKRLEEILTEFMKNIRMENDQLERKIYENEMRQQIKLDDNRPQQKPLNTQTDVPKDEWKVPDYTVKENLKEDIVETSLESQILQLAREGKSVDEIAKQLNRGKTEVDLLIKMNQIVHH